MGLVEILGIAALIVGLLALGLALAGYAMAQEDRNAAEWERFMAKGHLKEARQIENRAFKLREEAKALANAAGAEHKLHPDPKLSIEVRHLEDPPGSEDSISAGQRTQTRMYAYGLSRMTIKDRLAEAIGQLDQEGECVLLLERSDGKRVIWHLVEKKEEVAAIQNAAAAFYWKGACTLIPGPTVTEVYEPTSREERAGELEGEVISRA